MVFLINFLFGSYYFFIVVRAFLPWFPRAQNFLIIKPVIFLTDPLLQPIRKGLPPSRFGWDASPAIAILLVWCLQRLVLLLIG